MTDFYWSGDDDVLYLFAGRNATELARLDRHHGRWDATVYVPGVILHSYRNTLTGHKREIEDRVGHWLDQCVKTEPPRIAVRLVSPVGELVASLQAAVSFGSQIVSNDRPSDPQETARKPR